MRTVNNKIKKMSDEQIKNILANADDDLTLQTIGEHFDITRMRVCQIEKRSLHKIRELLENADIV